MGAHQAPARKLATPAVKKAKPRAKPLYEVPPDRLFGRPLDECYSLWTRWKIKGVVFYLWQLEAVDSMANCLARVPRLDFAKESIVLPPGVVPQ